MDTRISLSPEETMMLGFREIEDHDFFRTEIYSTASYFKVGRSTDVDLWLQQIDTGSEVTQHLSNIPSLKKGVALILEQLPATAWTAVRNLNTHHSGFFATVVRTLAVVAYLLSPKEILFAISDAEHYLRQLNMLWEQLVHLGKKGSTLEDALKLIVELTQDRTKYSHVTESNIVDMIRRYHLLHKRRGANFVVPYKIVPRHFNVPESRAMYGLIKREVDAVEFPGELEANEHTRLLMCILRKNVDRNLLLNFAVTKSNIEDRNILSWFNSNQSNVRDRDPARDTFDNLLSKLVSSVRGRMDGQVRQALIPLKQLYCEDSTSFSVSPEIMDIIQVGEIRRLVLKNRFIYRNHLIWAFYEMGHGVDPSIITHCSLPVEHHPPYHIYLASMKLAQLSGDKMRLENFIFAVLCRKYNALDVEMEMQQDYKSFLKALRNLSSKAIEGPVFVMECSDVLEDTPLEFNYGSMVHRLQI